MTRYVLVKIVRTAFVVFAVSLVAFLLLRLSGNPVDAFLPIDASEAQRTAVSHELGLDRPLPVQYAIFAWDVLHGNFGRSIRYGVPAISLLEGRFQATLLLTFAGLALATLLGVPLGIVSAVRQGGWLDGPVIALSLVAQVMPSFWLGLMLVLLFAVQLHWLPTSGFAGPSNLVLPAVTLAAGFLAQIALLVRSGMIATLSEEYTRTARAKGLAEVVVIMRHALRNALIPVITLIGLTFGQLLSGVVVLEAVFSWPGLGQLAVQSISARDFPVVQASVVVMAIAVVVMNLLADLICAAVDPRIRVAG